MSAAMMGKNRSMKDSKEELEELETWWKSFQEEQS